MREASPEQDGGMLQTIWEWIKANWVTVLILLAMWKVEHYTRSTVELLERISKQLTEIQSDISDLRPRVPPDVWRPPPDGM